MKITKELNPQLISEWNYERNDKLGIFPDGITKYSNKKVWWKCDKGHEWQSQVRCRTEGSKCPYCSGRKVITGENDLITTNPELIKEWNYERNNDLGFFPDKIKARSRLKVWWKCEKGHEWQTKIAHRTDNKKGTNCPYCAGKKTMTGETDLATINPELLSEWNYERNSALGIIANETFAKSSKKVWWKCEYGHEWQAIINCRANGTGCPYCKGKKVITGETDLATTNPELLKEWDYEKNNELKIYPTKISARSQKKVWWICSEKHQWKNSISNRTFGNGCPFCKGKKVITGETDLATTNPELLKEWDYEKNNELKIYPTKISAGSLLKVYWKCSEGHSWEAKVSPRNANGTGCPICYSIIRHQGQNKRKTLECEFPDLLSEWDYDKNEQLGLNPKILTAGSNKKAFWKCSKGHEWQAVISSRTRSKRIGCPFCSGKYVIKGETDLATTNPELLKEWDFKKNEEINLYPDNVSAKSNKKAFWKCSQGHEWTAVIQSRTHGTNCPVCYKIKRKNTFKGEK